MKILYKVVAAALSLGIIPVMVFMPFFDYCFNVPLLPILEPGAEYVADTSSLVEMYELSTLFTAFDAGSESVMDLDRFITPALTAAVFFVLIAVFAILTAVLAIVRKDRKPACYSAIFGIAFTFLFTISFNSLIAPFADGTLSLASLFNVWWISLVASVEYIQLGGLYNFIFVLFAAVLVWTAIFYLIEPKDEAKSSYKAEQ